MQNGSLYIFFIINEDEVVSSFEVDFCRFLAKKPKIAKMVPWFLADVHKDG